LFREVSLTVVWITSTISCATIPKPGPAGVNFSLGSYDGPFGQDGLLGGAVPQLRPPPFEPVFLIRSVAAPAGRRSGTIFHDFSPGPRVRRLWLGLCPSQRLNSPSDDRAVFFRRNLFVLRRGLSFSQSWVLSTRYFLGINPPFSVRGLREFFRAKPRSFLSPGEYLISPRGCTYFKGLRVAWGLNLLICSKPPKPPGPKPG